MTEGGSEEGGLEELVESLPIRSSRSAIRRSKDWTSTDTAACASGESVSQIDWGSGGCSFMPPFYCHHALEATMGRERLHRRVKTGKAFHRPMNRVVHAQLRDIMPADPRPDAPVFLGGSARPNARFQSLCSLAGIKPRLDIETGREESWELKDLRKLCATYHDEHVPESSVEILGHSVGGITYRHYAHRAPLAFRAIMTLPQPTAFQALVKGSGSECPCCRRRYADAG